MYNKYKRYPISIKQAKAICKEKLGRLPRMGYEVTVYVKLNKDVTIRNVLGIPVMIGDQVHEVCLVNTSGWYHLEEHWLNAKYYHFEETL